MDDHFWPAVYPGLAVGLLYGLYVGGIANAVLGALGGIVAAFLGFFLANPFFTQDGPLPLAALLVVSLAGAAGLIMASRWFRPPDRGLR